MENLHFLFQIRRLKPVFDVCNFCIYFISTCFHCSGLLFITLVSLLHKVCTLKMCISYHVKLNYRTNAEEKRLQRLSANSNGSSVGLKDILGPRPIMMAIQGKMFIFILLYSYIQPINKSVLNHVSVSSNLMSKLLRATGLQ